MALQILIVGLVVFGAHLLSFVFQRTRVPDVLLLMLFGVLMGPVLGVVQPGAFGAVGPALTTIALIVILFESGMSLSPRTLAESFGQTMLITISMWVVTAATVAVLMRLLAPVGWPVALMTGAILGGTSSAVVVPLIEGLAMAPGPRTVLFLESALTDVLCIVVAVALLAVAEGQAVDAAGLGLGILRSFGVALLVGALAAVAWSIVLGRVRRLPNTIYTTVAFVFVVYGVAELIGVSGAIAALALGFTLAMIGGGRFGKGGWQVELSEVPAQDRLVFGEAVFLLKTFFFIYLGLSLSFDQLGHLLLALAIVVPVYVERLGLVRLLASRSTTRRDAALMTAMVPKGLAAAVLAGLPAQHGLSGAEWVSGTVSMVVLLSICLTACLVLLIDRTPVGRLYARYFGSFALDETSDGLRR